MVTGSLYGIVNADGTMQVESNDRELRITLSHIRVIDEDGRCVEAYRSTYYIKDGKEWQQALNSANFKSSDDFLDAIRYVEDFTLAVRDIEQQKSGNDCSCH